MIQIHIRNVYSRLSDYTEELEEKLVCFYDNYWFSPKYKAGVWDGKYHFLKVPSLKFPTGLLFMVEEYLKENDKEYEIIDERGNILDGHEIITPDDISLKGITLRDYQNKAVEGALSLSRGILELPTGSGKAQPLDAKIYTPNGPIMMGSIKVGDIVLTPQGKSTLVIGVFPQGKMPIYKITFSNGDTVECTKEHLWKVYSHVNKVKPKIMNLETIIKKHKNISGRSTYQIALSKKLVFKRKNVLIYPYLMGVLLGDGSLTQGAIRLSSTDKEILDWIRNALNSDYKLKRESLQQCNYYIARKKRQGNCSNYYLDAIRHYQLSGLTSNKKFIPDDYKYNSENVRLDVLRGLMDTDGSVSKKGGVVEFYSTSKQLAEDVKEIIETLGERCFLRSRIPTHIYKGEKKVGKRCYTITVSGAFTYSLFKLPRKKDAIQVSDTHQLRHQSRMIKNIEFVGEKECQCILVNDSEHMYVTNHCIPTHNTEIAIAITKALSLRTLFLVHTKDLLHQTRKRFQERLNDKGIKVGVFGDGEFEDGDIIIGMVQSIAHKLFEKSKKGKTILNKQTGQEMKKFLNSFYVLFQDECLDGSTKISTLEGLKNLENLKNGDIIYSPTGTVKVKRIWSVYKIAYKYVLSDGSSLIASKDHLVPIIKNQKLGFEKIGKVDKLLKPKNFYTKLPYDKDEYMLGWILGDGTRERNTIKFGFTKDIENIKEIFSIYPIKVQLHKKQCTFRLENWYSKNLIQKFNIPKGKKSNIVEIPENLYKNCSVGVIKGLFDAEGYIGDGKRIGIDMTSEKCIKQLFDMLNFYGIKNSIRLLKRKKEIHKDRWRLSIYGKYINKFLALFKFEIERKNNSNNSYHALKNLYEEVQITTIEKLDSKRQLFDIEIDDKNHIFIANGIAVKNCHHSSASTWYKIGMFMHNAYYRFGLSGTALRRTKLHNMRLLALMGNRIYKLAPTTLIKTGDISDVEIKIIDNPQLVYGEKWLEVYNAGIVRSFFRNRKICSIASKEFKNDKRVMILVKHIEHGHILSRRLQYEFDVPSFFSYGALTSDERWSIKDTFDKHGDFVLIASPIYDEGIDLPTVNVLIIAAGGKSETKTIQKVGRGLRKKADGSKLIVYDFNDSGGKFIDKHSLKRIKIYKKEGFLK